MGWGGASGGSWGHSPWGGASTAATVPTYPSAQITSVEVLGATLLRVNFNVSMKVDGFLTDPSNYSIVPNGSSAPVNAIRVIAQSGGVADYVLLKITAFTIGERYTVDISGVWTTKGNTVDTGNSSSEFYGRVTKLDMARSLQPKMYNSEPDSILSIMLVAITGEDEKIGGTDGNG